MPNHVRNVVKFNHLKSEDDITMILNLIASPVAEIGYEDEYVIDFDKIIPEPCTKEECPPECLRTESSHIEQDEDRPWFDWYTWHNTYWGTKWGAFNGYVMRRQIMDNICVQHSMGYPTSNII